MSMSQEEIESLMNGLDFEEDNKSSEAEEVTEETSSNENMSEDDINELISQTGDDTSQNDEKPEEILENIEAEDTSLNSETDEKSVDDVLNNIEEVNIEESSSSEIEEKPVEDIEENSTVDDIDSLLASIDGVTENESDVEEVLNETANESESSVTENDESESESEKGNDIDNKINDGVFPFPVEQDTKVVNQLSQVANDSEEKASKIFDVLSNILDYNNNIQNDVNELSAFNEKQVTMLSALNTKFPNIEAFNANLEEAKKMGSFITDVNDKLNNGNMEIFEAMELMQYHDINRQKIERVMSVIRKLTVYLNNLFEDEGDHQEVAVAKHIHGDSGTGDLMNDDDLESLISEFNN